ncbi:putative ABC transporter, ATP-binding protein [Mesorhizobium plurifarium]|uniref:Putative ABC transporter, ATP-binding protein n=1 Tax=Mesorhizobium plurifarium TaxID=69974 RepID=A0A090GKF2_MESPL|nr:putative ABC transporter, ATP-binding protein [Mesorhizobium sp. SOD10]CDX35323.1 putative ABC transporter, ATP-binding protein [Mesorhizobium plurifarium]
MGAPPILELCQLDKAFGKIVIAEGIDLSVSQGEGLGIIGPNGAGKSTLFNLIAGDDRPNSGDILFDGRSINDMKPYQRSRLGIGRSYQIPQPFGKMTVFENVLTAAVFGSGTTVAEAEDRCIEILHRTGLMGEVNKPAGRLTLLQRKRLELARSLATRPRLLLLDEIAGGLTEVETQALINTIRDLRETGVTLIWIEHIVHALIATVDRLIVLNGGRIICDGKPREVIQSPEVRRIYLGVEPE